MKTRNIVVFFVLAFAFSWAVGIPLALGNQGIIPPVLPAWTHYLYAYGPMLSALIVAWIGEEKSGLRDLGARIVMWKVSPIWWVVALSPLVLGFLVVLVVNMVTGSMISLSSFGEVRFLPTLGFLGALVLWILTFGIGEEIGWRGFALPRLQNGRNALYATTILWIFWALWHLPAFFYLYDPGIVIGWLIGQFAGAIVFTWLYNSSGGSVLIVAIWHGCFNFITSTDAGNGLLAAVVSTLVMVWAVVVLLVFKPANLSHLKKVER